MAHWMEMLNKGLPWAGGFLALMTLYGIAGTLTSILNELGSIRQYLHEMQDQQHTHGSHLDSIASYSSEMADELRASRQRSEPRSALDFD